MERTYDTVIVGGGTSGAILAARLAAEPARRVALIEAGPPDTRSEILVAREWMALLGGELDYDYAIAPQPLGNDAVRHSRARVLGGCSSHNSCIAFIPPDGDFEAWKSLGARGWGPDEVAPYFARLRERVHIAVPPEHNPLNEALIEAAEQTGLPRRSFAPDDFGAARFAPGVGRFALNIRDGIRQSSSVAYLHPLDALPPNLTLLTETRVTRVIVERGRAVGVESSRGTIRAAHEVVLCCGAFDSPRLLLLSGIGPEAHLRDLGIPVRHPLAGVGENLQDHPEGVILWETTGPVPPESSQFWEVGIFAHSGAGEGGPDLMLHFGLVPFDIQTAARGYPTAANGVTLTPNVCRARSRGRLRLVSTDPEAPPLIDFAYLSDPEGYDARVLVAGLRLAREIAAQPALRPWLRRELAPGSDVTTTAALAAYARATHNTVYHPAGTCRMGAPDDPGAVVDPRLRVIGLAGLRVIDASIFPTLTSVNPAITCMMLGERGADLIQEEP